MSAPLFLRPSFHPRIWGGRKLETVLGYQDLPEGPVGECWGVSAHPNGPSVVKDGPHRGKTLAEVWSSDPGFFGVETSDPFPLLVKFLDARDWLSVQVHPNDEEAASLEGLPMGKTECWYVVDAEPGAELILGHTAPDEGAMRLAMEGDDWEAFLRRRPVRRGDFVYVPSGTIHAVGPGVLICEVQQSCDTTYRVFDFDRRDASGNLRALHLDKAKAVSVAPFDAAATETAGPWLAVPGGRGRSLVDSQFFSVVEHDVDGSGYVISPAGYCLLTVTSGSGTLRCHGVDYPLRRGDHIVTPGDSGILEISGSLHVIESRPR